MRAPSPPCGGPEIPVGPVQEYPLEEWPETPLELGEELGRIEGPEIYRVMDVLVDDDGSLVLLQAGDNSIRRYGPDGEPRVTMGREGQGPGEFMGLAALGWTGDSLWAYDIRQHRYSVLTPEGRFARVNRRPRRRSVSHVYPGDTLLVHYGDDDAFPEFVIFALATPEGGVLEEVARHQNDAYRVSWRSGDRRGVQYAPFWPEPLSSVSADGSRLAIVESFIDGPAAGSFSVTAVSPLEGDTLFARRYSVGLEPIPSGDMDEQLAAYDRMFPGAGIEAKLRAQGLPESYSPVEGVQVGRDGTVWLRMRPSEDGQPYRVLDPRGGPLGTLVLARRHRLLEVEQDELWLLEPDELDVESVGHYVVR